MLMSLPFLLLSLTLRLGHWRYGESHFAVHQFLELRLPQLVGLQSAASVGQQVERQGRARSSRYYKPQSLKSRSRLVE